MKGEETEISMEQNERSGSSENVTIVADPFENSTATISSVKSEDSEQQLICKSPQIQCSKKNDVDTRAAVLDSCYEDPPKPQISVGSAKSLASEAERPSSKSNVILYLGVVQLLVGVLMIVFGGLVIVHNASLSRVGSGLWSGCFAVVTGVLGVLAGINDSYGLYDRYTSRRGSALLTAFLAMSLISLATANMAAVLAGTGIFRDVHANKLDHEDQELLRKAWTPILTNFGFLMLSCLYCLIAIVSIYHTSKRVCPCFRPKEAFNHNQFDASYTTLHSPCSVLTASEKSQEKHPKKLEVATPDNREELSRSLEGRLRMETPHRIVRHPYYGTSASREKLVTNWLGGQQYVHVKPNPKYARQMKMKPQPCMLVPAAAGNTSSGMADLEITGMDKILKDDYNIEMAPPMRMAMCMPPTAMRMGYATMPVMGGMAPHHPHMGPPFGPPIYYPFNDMVRTQRRRSPRKSPQSVPTTRRNSQLTRSLERIHRKQQGAGNSGNESGKRKNKIKKSVTEADVIRTYTGLDRAIADEFIAACDVTRTILPHEKSDSSGFDTSSSSNSVPNKHQS